MQAPHGTQLLGALPVYAGSDIPDHWIILVDRGPEYVGGHGSLVDFHRYATAVVNTLDADTWYWANYISDQAEANIDLYRRAGAFEIGELVAIGKRMRGES